MHNWPEIVKELIQIALREDIGSGDITTEAIYSGKEIGEARILAKEDGILAGVDVAEYIIRMESADLEYTTMLRDGAPLSEGMSIAVIRGALAPILRVERTLLNFMQRMSGIASKTCQYTRTLASTRTRILDTRKTVPGHRFFDKMAVRIGGGTNHRMCLDDRFLIKENHIRMAGGFEQAITRCLHFKKENKIEAAIEIEVTTLDELNQVIQLGGVDYVMLDNMPLDIMREAVERVNGRFFTEASGNVTLEHLPEIAETGVDFISSGALTHSVKALDISLLVEE